MSQTMSFVNVGNKWFLMSQKWASLMSQQMGPSCNKKSFFSVAKDELFTSEKLGFLMS